jgi:hypothetical protein
MWRYFRSAPITTATKRMWFFVGARLSSNADLKFHLFVRIFYLKLELKLGLCLVPLPFESLVELSSLHFVAAPDI